MDEAIARLSRLGYMGLEDESESDSPPIPEEVSGIGYLGLEDESESESDSPPIPEEVSRIGYLGLVSRIGYLGLEDESESDSPPIPEEVQIEDSPIYRIERQLGKGGNGLVCAGRPIGPSTSSDEPSTSSGQTGPHAAEVAVKFQQKDPSGIEANIPREWKVYDDLGENHGIPLPRVLYRGQQGDYNILVMDLLGPSLQVQLVDNHPSLPLAAVACVAVEAISILEKLHSRGYIHGDVKPDNFLLGPPGTPDERKLFLIDLGLAVRWRCHSTGLHVRYHQSPDHFRGTPLFASVHAHLGRTSSRRDDLESLAYMLAFLISGQLPWHGFQAEDMLICKKKMATPLEALYHSCPPPFLQFAKFAVNLSFDEDPNYARYISLFRGMIGQNPYVWPVNADSARESIEGDAPPKSSLTRGGLTRLQWISIFQEHPPMRQRIRYNVDNVNLPLFIEEARADGMYVSSVASRLNLWAVVMDSGTGFTAQVHTISPESLPQNWIREQWARNYHITAIAGADNGSTLVVMSKGPQNCRQSYHVANTFPYGLIKRKWARGTYVTAMATVGGNWVVIMSSATGFVHQVVELDFQYPYEGIDERWKQGYFITSVAATPDQVAFVFSIPEEEPVGGPQEAAQTSNFPETVVAETWPRNYYLSLLCYSRPVS
ncbi:casein kinase 1-like protein HD16 [Eucalyptus grandis]|uniref:casein kinase 1-like protein HD16 n=1 Tax=Eucalyptus grandis TaxID=71139 RepID=UPI00192EB5E8|nr:casein kinase 1-like protein HD16 [Eucalyptus grandis]